MFAQLGYYICVPFAWLTRLFYTWTGSYGVALILFTLLVKLVLLPFQLKSKKSMLRMNRMQSKIKDIQTRYANNREKQQQEMADLYAREGVNPMSGCLWSFLPFPILIALYYIIRTPLRYFMSLSQSVIAEITTLATSLGYVAATDGQAAAYEQIYLAKFIHEHWADFDGKFAGLIDLNYNFLGMDLSAVGRSGAQVDPSRVRLVLCGIERFRDGQPVNGDKEAELSELLKATDIPVEIHMGLGDGCYDLRASDLGHEYVSLNADYRS